MAEWSEQWTIRTTEHGGVQVAVCPPRGNRVPGEVEVVPKQEAEQKIEAERQRLAHGGEPDLSPGDVIAAEPDGTITLDDGITTWNPTRACKFLTDQALKQGAAEERGRLREAVRRVLTEHNDAVLALARKAFDQDEALRSRRLEDDAASTRNCRSLSSPQ